MNAIEIRNLTYIYDNTNRGIYNINLQVREGEKIGIIGRNGSGKTTLLLHLNGLICMNKKVKIFGREVCKKNIKFIRKNVGMVFQNPDYQLFSLSVYDDVAYGPKNLGWDKTTVEKAVHESLEKMKMTGFEERFPQSLSIGEKKKVAIATVLSMNPKILVLDEPTSSLDPHARRNLIELLKTFNDKTLLIATHDIELVNELCDRIILMENGTISKEGNKLQDFQI